jgi:exonuclease SbcC
MKILYSIIIGFTPFLFFSQSITITDGNTDYSIGISGSKPSLQVSIPFADFEVVEKMLKKELKDFNGKLDDKKNEYFVSLGEVKDLGKRQFDVYAKIIGTKDSPISVCWSVDLGGAYMDKTKHSDQYSFFKKRLERFATEAAEASIDKQVEIEKEILKELEREKEKLVKEQENLKSDIEEFKKKITEKEADIQKAKAKEDTKKTEISSQENRLKTVERRKEQIKN